ncbi:MAG: radical SAM protein [Nanoarchaeota archaeon]
MDKDKWLHTRSQETGELSYISVAILGLCNLDCEFCYVGGSREGIWQVKELINIINEVRDFGLQKIELTGGEPLLYPELPRLLEYLTGVHLDILTVTNGTVIDEENSELFARHKVTIGVSLESIDEKISDEMANVKGSHKQRLQGIELLKRAGYGQPEGLPFYAIMATLKKNLPTYIETWKWAKEQGMVPIIDRSIPSSRCKIDSIITGSELRTLLDQIGEIEGEYQRMPFIHNEGCNRTSTGVHIDIDGSVYPCSGVPLYLGNAKTDGLTRIWTESVELDVCRQIEKYIKEPCQTCEEHSSCSGCRGIAYAVTGDITAGDPLCWKNKDGFSD